MKTPGDLSGIWRAIGGAFHVRFGGGAVGRLGQMTIWGGSLVVIVAIVAIIRDPSYTLWVLGALLLFLILGLVFSFIYSLLHPQYAALGDAQMERVIRFDQAAKERRDSALLAADATTPTGNPLLLEGTPTSKEEN